MLFNINERLIFFNSFFHYSGNFCEVEPSLCEILEWPCQNGGSCYSADDINILDVDQNGLGYMCFCPGGYIGINCEEGKNIVIHLISTH